MPELPEVETIRTQLSAYLPFEVKKVDYSPVAHTLFNKKEFELAPGMKATDIQRKGKLLNFCLEGGRSILSHLGMTGGWRISDKPITEKHTHLHLEIQYNGGKKHFLAYVDQRRFGEMSFVGAEEAQKQLARLGVDLTSPDFTPQYIQDVLKKHPDKQLKPLLLEQKYFAGLGNYIASEICARAGIRPTRRCGKISRAECDQIKTATDSVIQGSLKYQGLTFSGGYTDAFGNDGNGLSNLVVFHQKVCGLCGVTPVKKLTLAQRGTFYCPKCQK